MKENFPSMNFSLSGRAEYCIFVEKNQCMRNVLELKIEEWWAVLAPDTSISIEMTSPLWHDSGTFSYTFQLPYYANRHIFNASDKPESDVNLKTFRKRFGLYLYGVGFLFGDIVCTSDEIDTDNDRVDVEIRSANATFEDFIEGKNLTDLYLAFDCQIGVSYSYWSFDPTHILSIEEEMTAYVNETAIYPEAKYCNIPLLVNYKDKDEKDKGLLLSAHRAYTSPCLFALYVLKRIIQGAGFSYDEQKDCELMNIEDMKRLVIINNKFEYTQLPSGETTNTGQPLIGLYATSKNLPDIGIDSFLNSLKNAFGVRLYFDESLKKCKVFLLRTLFRNKETKKMIIKDVLSVSKKHLAYNGTKVAYNVDEGTEFNYSEYSKTIIYPDYFTMRSQWIESTYDTAMKIVQDTGNFYRTKVDKSSFDHPALFEVAQFLPFVVEGYGVDRSSPDEMTIDFNPVIPTSTGNSDKALPLKYTDNLSTHFKDPGEALFVDTEVVYEQNNYEKSVESVPQDKYVTNKNGWAWDVKWRDNLKELLDTNLDFTMGILRTTPDGSLADGYTVIKQNVDGFGNDEWIRTHSINRITSDSVSKEGAVYDYNGTDEGIGAPLEQLISLKIWNNKQNLPTPHLSHDWQSGASVEYNNNPTGPLPNRGLVPQFLSEYLHFMKHRKPISVVGNIHVSELLNVEWDKYHDVAGYRGLLDKIKFTVSMEGMSEVTVDHFII